MGRSKTPKPTPQYWIRNSQICWWCAKAVGGCNWSRYLEPVDGWEAIPTKILGYGGLHDSFKILRCPEFEREESRSE